MTVAMLCGCHNASERSEKPGDSTPKGARVLHYDYAGGRNVSTLAFDGGIACQADGVLGPMTFSSVPRCRQIGIRRLTTSEAKVLATILRYATSFTLRFTWLGSKFIVYDAIYGVCNGEYNVLNGDCNEPTRSRTRCSITRWRAWMSGDATTVEA